MMDIGQPDPKRARLNGPALGPWQQPSSEGSRQLPPPPPPAYQQHPLPFTRPPEPQHLLDRRPSGHTEHPQYEQHPDARRPSSGPSHGFHPPPPAFGAQREKIMVKRDPSDEPPSQYRPPSTGTPTDNVNAPLHDGPRGYLPPLEHHSTHPPYRPPHGPIPFPPPQSPMTPAEPYGHPAHYGGPAQAPRDGYSSVSYPSASNTQNSKRPKAQRAAQACDSCRALKAKCDEGRPSCSSCREKGIDCRYRDPPPKQQDKASQEIMDTLLRIEQSLSGMKGDIRALQKNQDMMMKHIPLEAPEFKQEVQQDVPHNSIPEFARPSVGSESHAILSTESPYSSTPTTIMRPPRERVTVIEDVSSEEEDGGDPGTPKQPSIPVNHTTGAARLLLEPAISEMCHNIIKHARIKNEKYPIIQEEKRGLLRLYGRGEGTDAPPGYDKDPAVDHGYDSTYGDTPSDVSSPAAGEEWGQIGGQTPPGNPAASIARGNINSEGMPDFSRETVWACVKSYKENINIMHPILIHKQLDVLVENFLKSTPESQARQKQASSAGFLRKAESPGSKRKRSPVSGEYPEIQNSSDVKPGHPFRSISSCLVLLVLALGTISQHKHKIDELRFEREKEVDGSWVHSPTTRNGQTMSPFQGSPSMTTPIGISSPHDTSRTRSRRTSFEGVYTNNGIPSKKKNLDIIPGLFYFALATDIIGNQLGGNTLQHVHANILAGLYHGQLARVMESHSYIHQACRGLQVILRPKLDRFRRIKEKAEIIPARDNPIVIAFWTCLQLESDIIAELPLPHSGILTLEDDMPSPNLSAASEIDGFPPYVMESYGGQLFLRKHLNQLHNMFYKPDHDSQFASIRASSHPSYFPTIEACESNLSNIPMFAKGLAWQENDPPATDILGARLRAKYYGAQVITYRSFILSILRKHVPINTLAEQPIPSEYKNSIEVPSINKDATGVEEIDPKVLEYAKTGIKALIKSTTAFYGLGDPAKQRLIVTNIWGTAHAQWGNILTLQAAYRNPFLQQYIDRDVLKELLEKTMSVLKLHAHSTSALFIDFRILQHTGTSLGLISSGPTGSFNSASTGADDAPMS